MALINYNGTVAVTKPKQLAVLKEVKPKQILVPKEATAYSVMYTVPEGKKFVGYAYATQATGLAISGIATGQTWNSIELTLREGASISEGSTANSAYIIGVEYDL